MPVAKQPKYSDEAQGVLISNSNSTELAWTPLSAGVNANFTPDKFVNTTGLLFGENLYVKVSILCFVIIVNFI